MESFHFKLTGKNIRIPKTPKDTGPAPSGGTPHSSGQPFKPKQPKPGKSPDLPLDLQKAIEQFLNDSQPGTSSGQNSTPTEQDSSSGTNTTPNNNTPQSGNSGSSGQPSQPSSGQSSSDPQSTPSPLSPELQKALEKFKSGQKGTQNSSQMEENSGSGQRQTPKQVSPQDWIQQNFSRKPKKKRFKPRFKFVPVCPFALKNHDRIFVTTISNSCIQTSEKRISVLP